jgi:hypothetical protein
MSNIRKNRPRWERMDRNDILLQSLVDQYLITRRTRGENTHDPAWQWRLI